VIQYRSQYNLCVLSEGIGVSQIFPVAAAFLSEIGIFLLLLHAIKTTR